MVDVKFGNGEGERGGGAVFAARRQQQGQPGHVLSTIVGIKECVQTCRLAAAAAPHACQGLQMNKPQCDLS